MQVSLQSIAVRIHVAVADVHERQEMSRTGGLRSWRRWASQSNVISRHESAVAVGCLGEYPAIAISVRRVYNSRA